MLYQILLLFMGDDASQDGIRHMKERKGISIIVKEWWKFALGIVQLNIERISKEIRQREYFGRPEMNISAIMYLGALITDDMSLVAKDKIRAKRNSTTSTSWLGTYVVFIKANTDLFALFA